MKMRNLLLSAAGVVALVGCGSSGDVPVGFDSVCEALTEPCFTGDSPPDLTSSYDGSGTTVSSTNELWAVGESEEFVAQLDTSTAGEVTGVFDMGSFSLEVSGASYEGEGDSFTIYGTDIVEDGDCSMEARVVVSGVKSASGDLTGELGLEFTDNISGSGCDAEVVSGYPGTGAVFSFTASQAQAS